MASPTRARLNLRSECLDQRRNPALITHRCATIGTFVNLPWGFKIFYGMLSDAVPIMGQHRKPYLVLGWSATLIGALAFTALPTVSLPLVASTCHCSRPRGTHQVSLPAAAFLFMLMTLSYLLADCAADAALVGYSAL